MTGCCGGVSREVSTRCHGRCVTGGVGGGGGVSREVSGVCGGGCDEVLPRCVTRGVGAGEVSREPGA